MGKFSTLAIRIKFKKKPDNTSAEWSVKRKSDQSIGSQIMFIVLAQKYSFAIKTSWIKNKEHMLLQLPFSYFLSFLNLILGLTQCDKAIELTRANIKHIINIYNI